MKNLSFLLLAGFVLVVCAGTGCRTTSRIEQPEVFTVVGVSGDARYFVRQSEAVHTLKVGDHISEGSVIQTASGMNNMVLLVAGKRGAPAVSTNPRPYDDRDKVILYENTDLKVSKLTARTVGGRKIWDTRLSLLAGSALCDWDLVWPTGAGFSYFSSPGPKVENIRPEPDRPYYEIRGSNIVVHGEHAAFFFAASGITRALSGAVALEFAGPEVTKDLFASQQYLPDTGQISQIEQPILIERPLPPFWDLLRPRVKLPQDDVSRRPF